MRIVKKNPKYGGKGRDYGSNLKVLALQSCLKLDKEMCMGGYLTRLRHNDFCHRSAHTMTIPSGLALE